MRLTSDWFTHLILASDWRREPNTSMKRWRRRQSSKETMLILELEMMMLEAEDCCWQRMLVAER